MKNVIINNKSIAIKPIDFGAICDLEELGFDLSNVTNKTFSSIRCAVAYHMDMPITEVNAEIENHIKNGGVISDFLPFLEAITESDFFQSLVQSTKNKK